MRFERMGPFREPSLEGALRIARVYRDTSAMLTVADELAAVVAAAVPTGRVRTDAEARK